MITRNALETLWICSFRYCLGRRTYIVSDFVQHLMDNILDIPQQSRTIILRDLKREIEKDNRDRELFPDKPELYSLGDDCDRQQWLQLYQTLVDMESGV